MHIDEHHDDCRRASYKRRKDGGRGGVAHLEFLRSFDTCHLEDYREEDYLIEDGTVHIVYASGSGPLYRHIPFPFTANDPLILMWAIFYIRINGVTSSKDDVGFQRTRLLKPPQQQKRLKTNEDPPRSLLIANVQLNIPAQETTY